MSGPPPRPPGPRIPILHQRVLPIDDLNRRLSSPGSHSGGATRPREAGFEGAEVHAWYELNQKRAEHLSTDDMLAGLGAALFKARRASERLPSPRSPLVTSECLAGDGR